MANLFVIETIIIRAKESLSHMIMNGKMAKGKKNIYPHHQSISFH